VGQQAAKGKAPGTKLAIPAATAIIAPREEQPTVRWRFRLPPASRRQFSLSLSVLVLILGAGYAYTRMVPNCCAPPAPGIAAEAVQQFKNTCVKEARHANGGGDLVMDDETEAKIGSYCGCVADGLVAKASPLEIAKIPLGNDTLKLLDAIVADCRAKLQ
jgi:hypothetical protein